MSEQAYLFDYNKWVQEKTGSKNMRPKSSDDCYTPPEVYNAVKNWVVNEYHLENKNIIRPFYPDMDYRDIDYDMENDVVIDNPPFSKLKAIIDFYNERNIKYWLFCQNKTCFKNNCCHVPCYVGIPYAVEKKLANGSIEEKPLKIETGFSTNLDNRAVFTSRTLSAAIKAVLNKEEPKKIWQRTYPPNALTVSKCDRLLRRGYEVSINKNECFNVKTLDSQRKLKVSSYSGVFLINTKKAKEYQALLDGIDREKYQEWKLSYREQELIKMLDGNLSEGESC